MGNFDWTIIVGPLVGAVIGYCTNFIAVKMLFRPLKEVRICGIKVPFTPGIIPKEQGRLAKAIGGVVGNKLLTNDTFREYLLADEIKNKIRAEVNKFVGKLKEDNSAITDKLTSVIDEDKIEFNLIEIKTTVAQKVYDKLRTMNIGDLFADQAGSVVKSKVQGSFLAMMINDDLIDSFIGPAAEKINDYIEDKSPAIIYDMVDGEVDSLLEKPFGDVVTYLDTIGLKYGELAVNAYETFVENKMEKVLANFNIVKIVEDKVNDMDVLEVEELLLSVIKKELNAVVNLGALIGFILGIIMIFI